MRCLPLVFLIALGACDRVRTTPPPVDAGPVCERGERLVNGDCRFVCVRDGDCATGQRCNLLTGSCEPKPPAPDASVFVPCTRGARRCSVDARAIEICGTNGSFEVESTCPMPDGYCDNEQCLACRPNSTRCGSTPTTVEVCAADGSGFRPVTCAGTATCTMGECRECEAGERRCSPDGRAAQECQRRTQLNLSTTWTNVGDNFDGTCITQQCTGTGAAAACAAPDCIPGTAQCSSLTVQQACSPTGRWQNVTCSTVPGLGPSAECQNGVCVDECGDAARQKSYFGCEYWGAVLDNSIDALFKGNAMSGQAPASSNSDFVFVATNQSTLPATVEVWRFEGAQAVRIRQVAVPGRNDPSRGLVRIPVPWQSITPASAATGTANTGRARYGYRVTATRPITLYQFNPIDAVKITNRSCSNPRAADCSCNETAEFSTLGCGPIGLNCCAAGDCVATANGNRCSYNTFSNDASLLLPSHILGTAYVAVTPGHSHISAPPDMIPRSSQVTIVATQDNTQLTIRSSASTLAGPGIAAFTPGETRTLTLNSYDMLSLSSSTAGADLECQNFAGGASWCRKANDLTGTVLTSDKPIAVFGTNPCLNVPFSRTACDHVEEQVFPFSTWGRNFVALPSHPLRLNNNTFATNSPPDHFKIVAGAAATLTITPPPAAGDVVAPNNCTGGTSVQANTCQLAGGTFIEFRSRNPFVISATGPIAVAQFLTGQGATTGMPTDPAQGDPSMIMLPPVEQWRSRYTVLASTGLRDNYLALTIDSTRVQSVEVDGVTVVGFSTVAATNYQVKNHPVSTGTHTVVVTPRPGQMTLPGAGVTVYGYDSFVSYGYTGGLDLTTIVTGINPGG